MFPRRAFLAGILFMAMMNCYGVEDMDGEQPCTENCFEDKRRVAERQVQLAPPQQQQQQNEQTHLTITNLRKRRHIDKKIARVHDDAGEAKAGVQEEQQENVQEPLQNVNNEINQMAAADMNEGELDREVNAQEDKEKEEEEDVEENDEEEKEEDEKENEQINNDDNGGTNEEVGKDLPALAVIPWVMARDVSHQKAGAMKSEKKAIERQEAAMAALEKALDETDLGDLMMQNE